MLKLTALLPRIASMSRAEFIDYHKNVHAPLIASDPFARRLVRRYEQAHNTDSLIPGMPLPPHDFDGIAELWFDTLDDIICFYTDEHYFAVIQPDEMRFIDPQRALVMISTVNIVF